MNKALIYGRLGQKPELKYTNNGTAVASFSVATSKKFKDKNGETQTKTQWHRIVVWSKLAELCNQYLDKGREVFIEGEMETREWEDQNGNKRNVTEIIASDVRFIGGFGGNDETGG